jgi:chemotaxis response regulator CheB
VGYVLVVDLGVRASANAERGAGAGAALMAEMRNRRLAGTVPVVMLEESDRPQESNSSASLLITADRTRVPAAVAQVRILAGHLWNEAAPEKAELSVLVVDDDEVDRENLRRMLLKSRVGPLRILTAPGCDEAMALARSEAVDIAFLDYRLRTCSGAQLLRSLRIIWADQPPPVISLTGAGSEDVAREMFLLGACDYVRKEIVNSSVLARHLRDAQRLAGMRPGIAQQPAPPPPPTRCIAICGSAGAADPLQELLDHMALGARAAVVVALHLPPNITSRLGTLLQAHSRQPLSWIEHGQTPTDGEVHLCPPGFDLGISSGRYALVESRQLMGVPSLDVLLESLAHAYRERATAVILSGLGADGARGVSAVKAAGGRVLTLDPDTNEYRSMIDVAVATGCVEVIGTPEELARALEKQAPA